MNLYLDHADHLLAQGRRLLGDDALARDAVHDIFLGLLQRQTALPAPCSPIAWLCTLTRHRCIDLLRRRRPTCGLGPAGSCEASAPTPPVEERSVLRVLLTRLSARQLHIAKLLAAGLSQQEVADSLGCSRQAIHKCVQTIRQRAEDLA